MIMELWLWFAIIASIIHIILVLFNEIEWKQVFCKHEWKYFIAPELGNNSKRCKKCGKWERWL